MTTASAAPADRDVAPTTTADGGLVRTFGWLVIVAGILMVIAGAATWLTVQGQLADENITVADDATMAAGDLVDGPISAWAQADVIDTHAREATDGATYAELERDDPLREVAMSASFLRASLFTSVVAFGVAAMAGGLGVVLVLIGLALQRLAREPSPS